MVQIKILKAKCAAATGHRSEAKENPRPPPNQNYEQPERFLKRRSGSLKRGAEIDLLKIKLEDFNLILASLKNSSNTALRLYNRSLHSDGEFEPVRFRPSDPTTCTALEKFSRALARAVGAGGWIQELELGFCISRQDIKGLSQSISCSSSLQHLSLAKSALGDERLQVLARGLCECLSIQVLDLSCCNLTDASVTSITSIIKVGVRRTADVEWRLSLREFGGSKLKRKTPRLTGNQGLAALDLSFNMFSDATSRQLCDILRLGAPLEALNMQGNRLRRKSAQLYLVVFQTVGVPRLVDLRKNLDGEDVGVLEDGRHLRSFSTRQAPFWTEFLSGSPSGNMPHQERNSTSSQTSSQKRKPGRRANRSPRPLFARDSAKSGEQSSELILTKSLARGAEEGNREHLERALVGWSYPTKLIVPRDPSPKERESKAKEACFPEPQGDDQSAGQVLFKPFIRLEDRADQISPSNWTNEVDRTSTSPILDVRKGYPDITESENRRNQSDEICGDRSPLNPNKQPSLQLAEKIEKGPCRALSPILDPATPELTSRKHPEMDPNMEGQDRAEQGRIEHPCRTSGELSSLYCQRAQRSVDNAHRDCAAKLDVRHGPNFASRSQLAEHKVRYSSQMDSEQSVSKDHKRGDERPCKATTDSQLFPGKKLGHYQNRGKTATSENIKREQRARPLQPHPIHSTAEWQREESEWGEFMWNMANSLLRLQEGLDFLMEPSQLHAQNADQLAATELHQKFRS